MGQPFFRKQTGSWYFKDGKKFIPLGKTREAADREWHRLMAGKAKVTPETTVGVILDKFLAWSKNHKAPDTTKWYAQYLEEFRAFVPEAATGNLGALALSALKPYHVSEWIDARYGKLSNNSQFGAARSVIRAMNWAVKFGYLERSPVQGIDKARPESRVVYIEPEQWAQVIGAYPDDDTFSDLLNFLRETGCRPQEAREIEKRHFKPIKDQEQIAFQATESKGKKHPRVIPLNRKALAIVSRLAVKYPEGKLFRNGDGEPWTRHSINCRFKRLSKRLKFPIFAYAIRHTFCSDALIRGVGPVELAIIMGHKDATMVLKVYQHLHLNTGHIRKSLAMATGEAPATTKSATA